MRAAKRQSHSSIEGRVENTDLHRRLIMSHSSSVSLLLLSLKIYESIKVLVLALV